MMFRMLSYLIGLLLVVTVSACADPMSPEPQTLHFHIDTSSKRDLQAAPAALDKLFNCQANGLIIAYAFGDVRFNAHPVPDNQCSVTVVVQGELGETPNLAPVPCSVQVLGSIDWIYLDGSVRDAPPNLSAVCPGE